MDRRRAAGKMGPNFPHLKALPDAMPRTKIGQIVWAWPEIQAGRASGRSMHEIWEALQLDGIEMSYGQFRTYVCRIRKKGVPTVVSATASVMGTSSVPSARSVPGREVTPPPQSTSERDPLANLRESERKREREVFNYRPELADPDKLI